MLSGEGDAVRTSASSCVGVVVAVAVSAAGEGLTGAVVEAGSRVGVLDRDPALQALTPTSRIAKVSLCSFIPSLPRLPAARRVDQPGS